MIARLASPFLVSMLAANEVAEMPVLAIVVRAVASVVRDAVLGAIEGLIEGPAIHIRIASLVLLNSLVRAFASLAAASLAAAFALASAFGFATSLLLAFPLRVGIGLENSSRLALTRVILVILVLELLLELRPSIRPEGVIEGLVERIGAADIEAGSAEIDFRLISVLEIDAIMSLCIIDILREAALDLFQYGIR